MKEIKKVSDLKQGDEIFDINYREIKKYEYLCIHPDSDKYHILIGADQEPIRIFGETLQFILNQNLKTRKDARLELANRLEEQVIEIRNQYKD